MFKKFYKIQNLKKALTIFLGLVFVLVIPISVVRNVKAAGGLPFGGMKTGTLTCTCSDYEVLYINDYRSGGSLSLLYQAGASKLYANNNVMGQYLLGEYQPGSGECLMEAGTDCTTVSTDGMLTYAGTS